MPDRVILNVEVEEFREVMPSVENIAMVIFRLLKPKFGGGERAKLASGVVLTLLGIALVGFGVIRRRRRRAS